MDEVIPEKKIQTHYKPENDPRDCVPPSSNVNKASGRQARKGQETGSKQELLQMPIPNRGASRILSFNHVELFVQKKSHHDSGNEAWAQSMSATRL